MRKTILIFIILGIIVISCQSESRKENTMEHKPRLIITTDIGGDPDDTQSLVRLLVSSNEFELEGIVASASGTLNELDTFIVRPDLVFELIDAYSEIHPNLILHDPAFPDPAALKDLVKKGNPHRGVDFIGEGMDTEGSEWIESRILVADQKPLNISIWGGQTDVAQALWSLKENNSPEDFRTITSGIRIYNINDQDRIHSWFRAQFPDLFHILAEAPSGEDKREGAYRGIYLGGDESLTSREWIYSNVKENHGPLGALYPDQTWTAPNPHGCMKEGDTPSWFYFLNMGLQDPLHPEYGGWGGRFKIADHQYYEDDQDRLDSLTSARAGVYRWRPSFQADFAARMDWCVKSYQDANHHPQAVVNGDFSNDILILETGEGKSIKLDAGASSDPDGDQLSFKWWLYPEPSDLEYAVKLSGHSDHAIIFKPGEYPESNELHLVLEVRDNGQPSLTTYRRVIVIRGS